MSYEHHSSPQNKHAHFLTSSEFQRLLLFAQIHDITSIAGAIFEKREIEKSHNNAFNQQKANVFS